MFTVIFINVADKELSKLPAGLKAAMIDAAEELEKKGPRLKAPNVRDLGHGLKKLRVSALYHFLIRHLASKCHQTHRVFG